MRAQKIMLIWFLLILTLTACSFKNEEGCPVTLPNGSTPPGETPSELYHGNGKLWTALWPDGEVIFEPGGPGEIRSDGSLIMKFPWWRGEGVTGELEISGQRLGGFAAPLAAEIPTGYSESGFQASGIIFPSDGCWEITARSGSAELTVVVLAMKVTE